MIMIVLTSMVADLTEEAERRTGQRSEAMLLASISFVRKATQSLPLDQRQRAEQASMHWLRHTHATRAAEREVPPDVLQENLGQSDPRTTARYYRAQIERRQRAMEESFGAINARPAAQIKGSA